MTYHPRIMTALKYWIHSPPQRDCFPKGFIYSILATVWRSGVCLKLGSLKRTLRQELKYKKTGDASEVQNAVFQNLVPAEALASPIGNSGAGCPPHPPTEVRGLGEPVPLQWRTISSKEHSFGMGGGRGKLWRGELGGTLSPHWLPLLATVYRWINWNSERLINSCTGSKIQSLQMFI